MFARILPALFVLGVLPALAADPLPAGVAARMGDVEIRLDELRVLLDGLTPEQRTQLARNPADLQRVVRTEALRRLMVPRRAPKDGTSAPRSSRSWSGSVSKPLPPPISPA